MGKLLMLGGITFLVLAGCMYTGSYPQETRTSVDLTKANFRIVAANATGKAKGFTLLFWPIIPTRYSKALSSLYSQAGMEKGKAMALVNVVKEHTSTWFVLFSIDELTVCGDVIEFTE